MSDELVMGAGKDVPLNLPISEDDEESPSYTYKKSALSSVLKLKKVTSTFVLESKFHWQSMLSR